MRDKFISYIESFDNKKTFLKALKELKNLCEKLKLYEEEASCLNKIWKITKDCSIWEEIGDIYSQKLKNNELANEAYNKFFYYTNPEVYKKYFENLESMQLSHCIDIYSLEEKEFSEYINLCDKSEIILYMIMYLQKINDKEGIIIISKYLKELKDKILGYNNECPSEFESIALEKFNVVAKQVSKILSESYNDNDICEFAIELDTRNEKAHFNILEQLILQKRYEEAFRFYNDVVCMKFLKRIQPNVVEVMWTLSIYYRDTKDFFKAIMMQKYALEMELAEEKDA